MQYSFAVKMSIYYPPMDKILRRKVKQDEKRKEQQYSFMLTLKHGNRERKEKKHRKNNLKQVYGEEFITCT